MTSRKGGSRKNAPGNTPGNAPATTGEAEPKREAAPASKKGPRKSRAKGAGACSGDLTTESGGPTTPYRVLARKYRPQTFDDLIGQDAMVRTLRNAFASGRIAQAYMLTGVRGVGKTTTARILARALNYETEAGDAGADAAKSGPSIDLASEGVHCRQIMESRHPDVLEMDAASNTGVDNVREIIEGARYKPTSARYKVYIIDEVHMLSKGAFNALLKTLEEPPDHVKFVFATTEIRKVPVTVLSRCQRFDLRRVDVDRLIAHFKAIAATEGAKIDDNALALIARAAEGSVRDGLSILDQAISTIATSGCDALDAGDVQAMLGLADRGRIVDLLEAVLQGETALALERFAGLYADGADPVQMLTDLAEAVHNITRIKAAGEGAASAGLTLEERARFARFAERLSLALLSRAWQMLVAGVSEAGSAPNVRAGAEMVLIRMAHMSHLPSPEELVRQLRDAKADRAQTPESSREPAPGDGPQPGEAGANGPQGLLEAQARPQLTSFGAVVDFVGAQRDIKLKVDLEEHVHLVRFEPRRIEINLDGAAPKTLANELGDKLTKWTGERWIVTISREAGEKTLGEVRREREAEELEHVKRHPLIQSMLQTFPDAEITAIRPLDVASDDTPSADDNGENSAAS